MNFINKIFSNKVEFNDNSNRAVRIIKILGIKFKHTIKNPLFYEKISSQVGIKTLLFLRTDGIGDFIFDLPYIKHIKASKKYKDYKIILLCSSNIMEIAKKYIHQYIDEYILFDYKLKNIKQMKKDLKNMSFTTIINPIDAKNNKLTEEAVKYIKAKEKICHHGYFSRNDIKEFGQRIIDLINSYTKAIDTGENLMLTKDRCHLFFELLLEENIPPAEKLKDIPNIEPDINSDYVIISPFSRSKNRTYSADNYVKIIDFITENYDIPVMIAGGNKEIAKAQYIKDSCTKQDMVYNIAGKPLSESILYIKRAKLLVANETGTVHIAQNYNVETVCISNGSYMGTFQPYPKEESYVTYVYPDNIFEYIKENNLEGHLIKYDINKIDVNKVNSVIKAKLNQESTLECSTI